jgi:putative transposase
MIPATVSNEITTGASTVPIRWCSDGFEIGCDNGERMRIACPSTVASARDTGDIRDPMVESVERHFGLG